MQNKCSLRQPARDVEKEYGRAIIFDYSYPRFYEDGYGKDYRILNLEQDLDPGLTNRYLMANLLTFYEQVRCYALDAGTFYATYNVAPPLLIFIGHSVTAGKTRSQLSRDDKRSLSDVQELVLFLHRVLQNENGWVAAAINAILNGEADLKREDGGDIFADAFRTLREDRLDGGAIYADMLRRIFHAKSATTAAGLHLVNLKSAIVSRSRRHRRKCPDLEDPLTEKDTYPPDPWGFGKPQGSLRASQTKRGSLLRPPPIRYC